MMEDADSLARLIAALRPWLGHLVFVGGWAHRLHRLHHLAGVPTHPPVSTRDVDIALSLRAPLPGDIKAALAQAGFKGIFLGDEKPPVTHHHLEGDAGFYAEFLVPLQGADPVSFIVQKLLIHDKRPPDKQAQDLDPIRDAAPIQDARRLSPEVLRAASEYGLGEIFGE